MPTLFNQLASGSQVIMTNRIRKGAFTALFWAPYNTLAAPYSGIEKGGATATENKAIGVLCVLEGSGDASMSIVNDQEIFQPNKTSSQSNDGVKLDSLEITLAGNAMGTLFALANQDPVTNVGFIHKGDYGIMGALIAISFLGDSSTPIRSTLYKNVKVKILTIPGITANGANSQQVTFYQNRADIVELQGNQTWTAGVFRKNAGATIVNNAAPDGSILTFALKDVNGSVAASPVTPTLFNSAATTYKQKMALVMVNGVEPATSVLSIAAATLTFSAGNAPANNATLFAIWPVDTTTIEIPNNSAATVPTSMWYGWEQYLGA